jgi:EmrB/QacA subfamily drug resistance transporter
MNAAPLCDRAIALAREGRQHASPGLVLAATMLASSLGFVDSSVVNVGLPAIGRDLHATAAELQWVINAYLLPLSALLLLGGALGDRYGQRRLLMTGITLFAAGSAGCAAAPGLAWLIAARGVQGLAAAMVLPNSLAILGGAFVGASRSRAVGLWAASASVAAAIGPVAGGWLIDTLGWRTIFLINLPLAAMAMVFAFRGVARDRRPANEGPLDVTGAVLASAALTSLVWGLTEGSGPGGWSAPAIFSVTVGLALSAAFVGTERRRGEAAMAPLALFGSRPLVALNLLTLLLYGALAAFMLLVPYLLITTAGYSATAAGAALLPFPLVLAVVSPAMGDMAGRIGPRRLLIAGAGLVAVGFLLALRAGDAVNYWTTVLPSLATVALGMACAAAPLTAAVLGAVDARHTGAASGLNSALAQLGGVVTVALLGGVLGTRGPTFVRAFHLAVVASALASLLAGVLIVLLYDDRQRARARPQASP